VNAGKAAGGALVGAFCHISKTTGDSAADLAAGRRDVGDGVGEEATVFAR